MVEDEKKVWLVITHYSSVVFAGQFPSLAESQHFYSWWAREKRLPVGAGTHSTARFGDHLPYHQLTTGQKKLIADKLATMGIHNQLYAEGE